MFAAQQIPYNQTNAFTKIVLDYLSGAEDLRPFYSHRPSIEGFKKAIQAREKHPTNRDALVQTLVKQYNHIESTELVKKNIQSLLSSNSFTVCTAHQPNLFTGPLYFIYKILHTVKLAEVLKKELPEYNFVPVYYMGSEDADFAELNHTYVNGKKIEWNKLQTGAVGRMVVDKTLVQLVNELEGQLAVEAHGNDIIGMLRRCYTNGRSIQEATFELVNELYGSFGLVVLIPDYPSLKKLMTPVFSDDLFRHTPATIVKATSEKIEKYYDPQAYPRDINLFYLVDDIRERIEKKNDEYSILNTQFSFTEAELKNELDTHPERFSPNVILRGLYQETILPNLAFVGGGGELAYWLQLKELFENYKVPYPVLVLRNSFLVVEEKWQQKISRMGLGLDELFKSETDIMKSIVQKYSKHKVLLNGNFEKANELFEEIKQQAEAIDPTLSMHVTAIKARSLKTLEELEKKMLRAEKRKFSDQQNQVRKIKEALFPNEGLQERVENISGFYAKWGGKFIDELYKNSLSLEQLFTVLVEE
ncbi:MAG: bacillithiol biosynthesis cysteine-adding enzyme BshC [Flavisolibacter sp.]